jgi:U3 small nucleolar RNA-associated protein 21
MAVDQDATSSSSEATSASSAAAEDTAMKVDGTADATNSKRKRAESVSTAESALSEVDAANIHSKSSTAYDDSGSSRLFQPHRSLGLLTAATPSSANKSSKTSSSYSASAQLFTSQKGKFHLQPQATSSEETFVTVPLGERFQIMTLSKLVPVLVSRALPPSAEHHRLLKTSATTTNKKEGYKGGDEEEMHQAISDSSLNITLVTHGPKITGRAVSITMYSRTRPIVSLDAFPFLKNGKSKKRHNVWGIVGVVQLGKTRVAMTGEKEGKMENALLFAIVCAKDDAKHKTADKSKKVGKDGVQVVGHDSDGDSSDDSGDEGEASASKVSTSSSSDASSSSDGDDSMESLEDKDVAPEADCHGRILLVQASRTTMEIIKTIDLNGVGANFIPYVGLHPATYVNKILLGGRQAAQSEADAGNDDKKKKSISLLLVNVRSGKMIHSFQCLSNDGKKKKKQRSGDNSENKTIPTVTTLAQSPAVDTIAVGTSDGSVHLVNTLHDVNLFSLQHKGKQHVKKSKGVMNVVSSISFRTDGNATRQGVAPLAVGTDDGTISVWDLTPVEDENDGTIRRTLLTQIEDAHFGGLSKLEYLPGEPLLLSTGLASNSIVLHVFDAPDHSGRVLRQRKGHTSPPTLLRYLHPGLSGGGILANAADGTDASSCQILSCGGPGDLSLRLFSTARSNLDKEYSQGPGLDKKAKKLGMVGPEGRAELLLPEIAALATSEARSRDWGDLVTIHRNHAMAYVWSTKRGSQSGPVLRQPHWNISAMKDRPPRSANATSLAISACGNFALVGTVGGVVYKYNLQSGLPRGSFPRDAASLSSEEERRRKKGLKFAGDVGRTMRILEKNASKGGTAPSDKDQAERDRINYLEAEAKRNAIIGRASHDDAVVGIAIDSLNKTVVTAGADSKLVLWNFVTHMPHKKSPILLPSPATKMTHVRDSDLAAIAMNDFGVAVFDCSSLNVVRYFGGSRYKDSKMTHTGPISDMNFGPDGRKLFTSSFDGTVRVWDVPTGLCVDWMSFSSPPTSLALSPTGEFMATSHVGRLGISLWCDKSFFRMVLLDGTPNEPAKMNEPCPVAECEQEGASDVIANSLPSSLAKKDEQSLDEFVADNNDDGLPPQAKERGLITLSGLPPAHWKNLFNLELVKERNKPTEAPQKPPQAPFFLQWRSGLESGTAEAKEETNAGGVPVNDNSTNKDAADAWDAVWSDDDAEGNPDDDNDKEASETQPGKESSGQQVHTPKRRKVVHHRSKLSELLQTCFDAKSVTAMGETYSEVTSYLATMGPSSIDVEISSLCYGIHDLEDGLPLLHLASMWLLEACESHQSFEAVNAYLHRFLHVHGNVITRLDQSLQDEIEQPDGDEEEDPKMQKMKDFIKTITQLQMKQKDASNRLQGKMQHTLCLLRHLSRMV